MIIGAAGPVVFVTAYLINGATLAGYDSWHDTISALALAPHGWIQVSAFLFYGATAACFALGLRRSGSIGRLGFGFLLAAGLGLLVAGTFTTDPVLGFPEGEHGAVTLTGTLHNLGALMAFVGFPVAAFTTMRHAPREWAVFSGAVGVLSLVSVVLFFANVAAAQGTDGGASIAGLFERLPTVLVSTWQIALVARVTNESTVH